MYHDNRDRQRQAHIKNYQDLYEFVKNIKHSSNREQDVEEIINQLIYRWFSQKRVHALDSCYDIFNKKLAQEGGFLVRYEDGTIKAEFENNTGSGENE